MTTDELEQYCNALEVELIGLRSLVVALIRLLDISIPGIGNDIIGGLSGASSAVLGDESLAEQGARAVEVQIVLDDLCNRIRSGGHNDS